MDLAAPPDGFAPVSRAEATCLCVALDLMPFVAVVELMAFAVAALDW